MHNPWARKMEQFTDFTPEQRRRLDALVVQQQQGFAPDEDIVSEGQKVDRCHLILSGLAIRYKLLPDGRRQILAFLIPGDLCDAEVFVLERMDHNVGAITPTTCALIPAETMRQMLREISSLSEALWWGTMTDLAILRERLVDIGRRDARARVAHLIYEMLLRYRMAGETSDDVLPWPITQDALADATGLTTVHINRTLRQMREEGLIAFDRRALKVLDPERIRAISGFNPNYLHLRGGGEGGGTPQGRSAAAGATRSGTIFRNPT